MLTGLFKYQILTSHILSMVLKCIEKSEGEIKMILKNVATALYINEDKRKQSNGLQFYELYSTYGEENNPTSTLMGSLCVNPETNKLLSVKVGQYAKAENFKE